jgi:aerobic carbon-monoxide dehydrogenase medium subunit
MTSFHQPESIRKAVSLARTLAGARFLAGGTDLMVQMTKKGFEPEHLIDLTRLSELSRIVIDDTFVTVGALATHKQIELHPAFQKTLVGLVEAARVVGGHQIRNRGTVGGNIANASPAADVAAALLALDAEVSLTGEAGARSLRLEEFLLGPGRTARRDDELLTAVRFPNLDFRSATAFLKAGRRRAMEISVVCVAARLAIDDGVCRQVRIALGAVDETARRARAAEAAIEGRAPAEHAFRQAGKLAASECRPISDVRASAAYRRRLVEALVPRALERCVRRIGGRT